MRKIRVVVALAVIAGTMGWVVARGLAGNLVYYVTPADVRDGKVEVGERARLGGYVEPGTVVRDEGRVEFVVTDRGADLRVIHRGVVPSLFRDGQGVVVEGMLRDDGVFHSENLLIKHDAEYAPPGPGETPHEADLEE